VRQVLDYLADLEARGTPAPERQPTVSG